MQLNIGNLNLEEGDEIFELQKDLNPFAMTFPGK